jgi:phosphoglycolate phosphatase
VKPCLIFDLDGTLVDSLPGIAASLNRSLELHGLPAHSNAAVRSFVGNGVRMLVQRAVPAGTDPASIDSLVALFKKDYDQSWKSGTQAYPGITNLLNDLQRAGYPLAVLSNKTHEFTVSMVAGVFPIIHFGKVLGQREGTPQKPHPAGAFLIAETLGFKPEHCVFIGDSTVDLETARNADMPAIAVLWGYHDRAKLLAAGAERLIEDPSELEAMLDELGKVF